MPPADPRPDRNRLWVFGLWLLLAAPAAASSGAPGAPAVRPSPGGAVVAHPIQVVGRQPREHPDLIRLRSGAVIDPAAGRATVPERLAGIGDSGEPTRDFLVYYGDAPPEAARAQIRQSGGTIVSYLPDRAFLVRAHPGATMTAGGAAEWVGAYRPAYKLSPRLDLASTLDQPVTALLFADGDADALAARIAAAGGRVLERSSGAVDRLVRALVPAALLPALARDDDVAWLEPYLRPVISNDNASWVTQTGAPDRRRLWELGLRGEGQVLMTSDTGIDVTHDQFRDPDLPITGFGDYPGHRKVIAYRLGSANPNVRFGDHGNYHGSHTACTAAGSDDGIADSPFDGMAKAARLYFMDLSGPILGGAVDPFADLNDLFLPSYLGNAGGAARISSNSWGSPVMGDYDLNALAVDQFAWAHPDYLIVFADGNDGGPQSVNSPATAKNVISAGGVVNGLGEGSIYASTSRGPTVDGRWKPTVCAPAQGVVSANTGPNHYLNLSGTSMASPCVAGTAALMRQYCTDGWYPTGTRNPAHGFAPSAALLRAMCVGSGTNQVAGFAAPDANVGYGRVNADSVLYFAGDQRRLVLVDGAPGLGHLQSIEYQVTVTDGSQPLQASLCWTDWPGNPAAAFQLVNDLDLVVTHEGEVYRGNVYAGGVSIPGGSPDRLNVEEAVRVAAPAPGTWTVRVEGVNVPMGPQPFGLCVTGGLGTVAGSLSLDRPSYGGTGVVGLRVVDTNGGPGVTVAVHSTTDPIGEDVRLEAADGLYSGALRLSPFPGAPGDGVLQVSSGDRVVAVYRDDDPAQEVTASATVAFDPPRISQVAVAGAGPGAMRVSWTTDRSATSRVYYGPGDDSGLTTALDTTAVLDHQVLLTGLAIGRDYCFDVESADLNGNRTRDDNGGRHYHLTAQPGGDVLLVLGGPFDRGDRYADALDRLGWSYDVWSGAEAGAPELGDPATGLRSYKAVWWQVGPDTYPPFTDAARDALARYLDGGGRLAVVGHDIARALGSAASPYADPARAAWLAGTLHVAYRSDSPGWTTVTGVDADPISGPFATGLPYREQRYGASGDEIDPVPGDGTAVTDWLSGDATPQSCGLRWESGGARGAQADALWGGRPSRLVAMFFEWSGLEPTLDPAAERVQVMGRALGWLLGRDRPVVALESPRAGTTVLTDTLGIRWSETVDAAAGVRERVIEYSPDGGASWATVARGVGPSPYLWDLRSVPNSARALLRVRVTDGGAPEFTGTGLAGGCFAIRRRGGDAVGPAVAAGSVRALPNPIDNRRPATLDAVISDDAAGGGAVTAAEWSAGESAAPPGAGHPMSGEFGATEVAATAAVPAGTLAPGLDRVFVRGRDQAGNWGAASTLEVAVNGAALPPPEAPLRLALEPNVPNPVLTTTQIGFSLPDAGGVRLALYDVQGRRVRELLRGRLAAGAHRVTWDRTDDAGRRVRPGIYYYCLTVGGRRMERKLVTLR